MRRFTAVLAYIGLVFAATEASASLITFRIAGTTLECPPGGSGCQEFADDTGLPHPDEKLADFGVTFTLDTSAPVVGKVANSNSLLGDDFEGLVYLIDSPGTGLSIDIGALTLFSSRFLIAIGAGPDENTGSTANAFRIYDVFGDSPEYYFELGSLSFTSFSSFSLNELVSAPMSEFGSMMLNASSCSVRIALPQRWSMCGGGMTISTQSVPEPEVMGLFCLGLAGLGLVRRQRRTVNMA